MTSQPPAHDAFLTTEEVLEYLQVNLRTVYRLIKSNSIPAGRVGRKWRFKKQDIDAWLEGRQGGTAGRHAGYLTKPLRDDQVLEAAARALGVPAA